MVFDLLNPFAVIVDPLFAPLLALKPHVGLFIFSMVLTTIIYGINRLMINRKVAKEIKEKLAIVKENLTRAQKEGRKSDINKFLSEYMAINNQYLRQTFKVIALTFIVVIILFPWANARFSGVTVANLPFSLPVIGNNINWIGWYILVSITGSWLLRKFLGE
ncbi:MAG: EMC3/TMCO1 family protein [Candidatus Aenigmatarchaeota archaeon]|nr:TMCO1/EMC3 family protein [Candidatus Aenigmarchaeota archaeon]